MMPPRHPPRRSGRCQPRPRQRGFILVMTMWVLAAIAIAASYFAERVQTSLQLATAQQSMNDGQIALSDARADMLFRLGTTPLTLYGLGNPPGTVALDGRPYRAGNTTLQLQDGRGLLNLNLFADEQMQRLLATLGVPAEQRAGLIDTLRDYTDDDDLRRLNGAEIAQYQALRLPPPRNQLLISALELRQIIGWRELPALRQSHSPLLEFTIAGPGVGAAINPNTAPWQVLTALPGVTEAIAKAIIERRNIAPVSVALLDQMLGTQMAGLIPIAWAFPSDALRLTQSVDSLPWAQRYNLTLTPDGASTPWTITFAYRLPKQPGQASHTSSSANPSHASDPPKLPARVAATASSPGIFSN